VCVFSIDLSSYINFPKTSGQFLPGSRHGLRRELSDVQRLRREHREAREQLVALRAEVGFDLKRWGRAEANHKYIDVMMLYDVI